MRIDSEIYRRLDRDVQLETLRMMRSDSQKADERVTEKWQNRDRKVTEK